MKMSPSWLSGAALAAGLGYLAVNSGSQVDFTQNEIATSIEEPDPERSSKTIPLSQVLLNRGGVPIRTPIDNGSGAWIGSVDRERGSGAFGSR